MNNINQKLQQLYPKDHGLALLNNYHPHRPQVFPKEFHRMPSLQNLAFLGQGGPVGAVGGWVELARTTLGAPADIIDVTSFSDKRYYMILSDLVRDGLIGLRNRVGTTTIDTGSNYAKRVSEDGAADATGINLTFADITLFDNTTSDIFQVAYGANLSAKEKLVQAQTVGGLVAGAGTAPNRAEGVFKWVNTAAPMQSWRAYHASTGSFDTGSELVVLGWDPADVHTTNFWEEIFSEQLVSDNQNFSTSAFTAKKYLWLQFFQVGMSGNSTWRFNGDSTTSYARRHEINGGADATVTSQTSLLNVLTGGTGDLSSFTNAFIVNNSANEKLIIFDTVFTITSGAGTAPQRIQGVCKWDDVAAQITSMTVDDSGDGFDTGSFLKIWGAN